MADKPILFSGPMVRALLAGTKTQTRREFSTDPCLEAVDRTDTNGWRFTFKPGGNLDLKPPRIAVGDRLYVRETFVQKRDLQDVVFRADYRDMRGDFWPSIAAEPDDVEWKPSIHMPRWASRLTLTVTDVRVERLQDISDADAQAEGTPCYVCGGHLDGRSEEDCHCFHRKALAEDYSLLWEAINGLGSWEANPWVAAYTFTVERGNIDKLASAA